MSFTHHPLRLVEPAFSSSLIDLIMDLDHLRRRHLAGTTHPRVFEQLKQIFHMLESIGSARIEGNNTTVAEYVETKIRESAQIPESIKEIRNMENALEFIDNLGERFEITRDLVCEIHRITVDGLIAPPDGEGDGAPGYYRTTRVSIRGSRLLPPDPGDVQWYMDELYDFINRSDRPKYDLLKTAVAHHRFVWIHPFTNGNGRTVRLLTYALLVKCGFSSGSGRLLNPAAVFCSDRMAYYQKLSDADAGTDEAILAWCEYALGGIKAEIEKLDRLLDYDFLKSRILVPAIRATLENRIITETESRILLRATEEQVLRASHLADVFRGKLPQEVSRNIARLRNKKMLSAEPEGTRRYILRFDNNYLLRSIIAMLSEHGFLPVRY